MFEWQANRLWHHSDYHRSFGINIGQRMTIIRLENETLLIHNPVSLTHKLKAQLDQLGTISCITTVNQYLHQNLSDWWLSYPNAYFFAAPGLATKRTDIGFDGLLNSTTSPLWKSHLHQTLFRGNDKHEEVIFCDTESNTLIWGQSLLLLNQGSWIKQATGKIRGNHLHAQVPLWHRLHIKEPKLLRRSLQEILTWPFEHILPIHGDPILFDGKKKLANAYSWILNSKSSP